jgi:hypothetical protein
MIGPGDVKRTAIAIIPKSGETRITPGIVHSRSKPRFQMEVHQKLGLEHGTSCWENVSVSGDLPFGTSHGKPTCVTREGAPAIYSGEEGRYGSLLKVCDLRVHRTDVLVNLRLHWA